MEPSHHHKTLTYSRSSFFNRVQVGQKQASVFGHFFLAAAAAADKAGLRVMFGAFEELSRLNREQSANWHPLTPLFDPKYALLSDENAFCIFGVNEKDEIVACQAARLFDWTGSNFTEEATSLRLFYADPASMRRPGETCIVTVPFGQTLTGRVVYSGAAWIRPDYRGLRLGDVFPRIGKVYAYALWQPDLIVGLMSEQNWKRGLATKAGYTTVGWAVEARNGPGGDWRFALLTMAEAGLVAHIEQFLGGAGEEIDRRVLDRGAEHPVSRRRITDR